VIAGISMLVTVAAATPAVYFYRQYALAQQQIVTLTSTHKENVKMLTAAVAKLIELPEDGSLYRVKFSYSTPICPSREGREDRGP
jgi:hypothetical protein